jgi:hypothetical protein
VRSSPFVARPQPPAIPARPYSTSVDPDSKPDSKDDGVLKDTWSSSEFVYATSENKRRAPSVTVVRWWENEIEVLWGL